LPPSPSQPAGWELGLRKVRSWLPALGLLLSIAVGAMFGLGTALLVLAASILLSAISMIWSSLQLVAGDSAESAHDVVLLAAPGTEFEQKQAVLRALKDLDFERSLGKISEEDYLELRGRYRARARSVLQTLDREIEPERGAAEKLVAAYLKKQGIEPVRLESPPVAVTHDQTPQAPHDRSPEPTLAQDSADRKLRACPSCSTRNDVDATFCKKCGQRIDTDPRSKVDAEP
jgi:hypothetical protein